MVASCGRIPSPMELSSLRWGHGRQACNAASSNTYRKWLLQLQRLLQYRPARNGRCQLLFHVCICWVSRKIVIRWSICKQYVKTVFAGKQTWTIRSYSFDWKDVSCPVFHRRGCCFSATTKRPLYSKYWENHCYLYKMDDEFETFGKHIANQLRRLPLHRALQIQQDFQSILTRERIHYLNMTSSSVQECSYSSSNDWSSLISPVLSPSSNQEGTN